MNSETYKRRGCRGAAWCRQIFVSCWTPAVHGWCDWRSTVVACDPAATWTSAASCLQLHAVRLSYIYAQTASCTNYDVRYRPSHVLYRSISSVSPTVHFRLHITGDPRALSPSATTTAATAAVSQLGSLAPPMPCGSLNYTKSFGASLWELRTRA